MKFLASLGLLLTASTPALAAGQLPTSVVPVAYDIKVLPDAKAMTFSGSEDVTVRVEEATRTITLNAANLAITAATFDGKPTTLSYDETQQQITLTLPSPARVGKHTLHFAWTGEINRAAAGLFAIDYTNPDGSAARMLATQFEAPDARRFAPMWDEPAFKARFTLSAVAPAGQTAYSNMPAAEIVKQEDGSTLYRFGQTPVMSSYLLFLGMGDVERKTVSAGDTEIGVITRRGVVDQGDYALQSAQRLLTYYNDYFGQPYPLPKLDMIAGPGSSQFFGAMENWGAIFYFEPTLLFDPARSTTSDKQGIFSVVAHEMAHQWFGDLVTMRWWDDLWLNEGFASWMEGKVSAELNPEWKGEAQYVAGPREAAMYLDAQASTHPIIQKLETVDQIGQAFDGITYSKGEAVINMLEATVGAEPFREGIRRYMAKHKYSNTVTDQLWAEISAASGRPVATFMHDFTLQGGVPLIRMTAARCEGGKTQVTLTQGRFGIDEASKQPQTWHVPVPVSVIGGGTADSIVQGSKPQTISVEGCGTVVLNPGKDSYFRAQYDAASHAALVKGFDGLSLEDKLGTLGDDLALATGGYQPLTVYFETLGAVDADAGPLIWSMVSRQIGGIAGLFENTPLEPALQARITSIFEPVLQRIGIEQQPDESPLVTNLREDLVGRLGRSGDARVAALARDYVAKLAGDPDAIPPGIRGPILSTYAINATPAEWEALLALTRAERNPVVKNSYVRLLGAAKDDALARRALDLVKSDAFTAPQRASLLRAIAGRHPDMAFDFAVANLDLVNGFLEASTSSTYVVGLGGGSNDPGMPAKIKAFAEKHLPASSRAGAEEVLTRIANQKASADRLRPAVEAWLKTPAR